MKALRSISDLDWQAIILGTGVPALEAEARQMENDFPDRVRAAIRFDNQLSHLMYAGADILMMPSRYEPCGLAQMIAMRYGCIPVAHATGGLVDTIRDHDAGQGWHRFPLSKKRPPMPWQIRCGGRSIPIRTLPPGRDCRNGGCSRILTGGDRQKSMRNFISS